MSLELTQPTRPVEIFISYSHEDEHWMEKLRAHLSPLKLEGKIVDWHDRDITAGTEWADEISEHLESASIVLLLISASFMASEYCWGVEVTRAIARHEAREASVIPVILRDARWQKSPIGKLQALPKDGKAVVAWTNRDAAFVNVIEGVERAIKELAVASATTGLTEQGLGYIERAAKGESPRELGESPRTVARRRAAATTPKSESTAGGGRNRALLVGVSTYTDDPKLDELNGHPLRHRRAGTSARRSRVARWRRVGDNSLPRSDGR